MKPNYEESKLGVKLKTKKIHALIYKYISVGHSKLNFQKPSTSVYLPPSSPRMKLRKAIWGEAGPALNAPKINVRIHIFIQKTLSGNLRFLC